MDVFINCYVFILGLLFGSFALAMADRMKAGKDWVKGRSDCDHCGHVLQPRDLVPLLSWLLARGRCRHCKKKLTIAYPVVEFITGAVFLLSWLHRAEVEASSVSSVLLAVWLLGVVLMMGLAVYDLRWYLLPNNLVYPLIVVAGIYRVVSIANSPEAVLRNLLLSATAVLAVAGTFWLLYTFSKGKWIGYGDVRFGVVMGLFLGSPVEAWLAVFVASTVGVIISLPKLIKDKNTLKMKLPFGPLLIAGLIFTYLFGSQIVDWYASTFLYL